MDKTYEFVENLLLLLFFFSVNKMSGSHLLFVVLILAGACILRCSSQSEVRIMITVLLTSYDWMACMQVQLFESQDRRT